jgi:hypothetical protein
LKLSTIVVHHLVFFVHVTAVFVAGNCLFSSTAFASFTIFSVVFCDVPVLSNTAVFVPVIVVLLCGFTGSSDFCMFLVQVTSVFASDLFLFTKSIRSFLAFANHSQ